MPLGTSQEKKQKNADFNNETAILVYGVANLDHLLSRQEFFVPKADEPNKTVTTKSKKTKK